MNVALLSWNCGRKSGFLSVKQLPDSEILWCQAAVGLPCFEVKRVAGDLVLKLVTVRGSLLPLDISRSRLMRGEADET